MNMKLPRTSTAGIVLLALLQSSCGGSNGSSDNISGAPNIFTPTVTIDTNGFNVASIPFSASSTGVLKWKITGTDISFQISCTTTGWVGMGINPSGSMTGADIVMGYVTTGATVEDMHATGFFAPTTDITNHLSGVSGTEIAGTTELVFTRALDTADSQDKVLVAGQDTIMLFACGPGGADNFMTQHQHKAALKINL
ncbi:MAG: DOMON domain-containing protein [Gammaproteobacteria bacterium]|nr:DOMON domain-containing protein [Gammaproteobacteria bacterium]